MHILRYISVLFLIYSVSTIGQTTYNGPASGNVSSGVMVTTDNFSFIPMDGEILGEQRIMEFMENKNEPMLSYGDGPVFDNYLYVENGTAQPLGGFEIGINFELHSFESIGYQNLWPPDPAMSVGPNHVVAAVNNRFHIYDREGNLLKNIDEGAWIGQILNTPTISDPQVIYDHHNGKWVMLWFTRNTAILEAPFVICHSDDENPLGIWYMYAINSELNGSTYAGNWGDYPKIGYDDQALYINSRQFAFAGGYNYNKIRILNSSDFYAAQGGSVSWTDIWNIRVNGVPLDVIHPFYSYDTGINTAYFVYSRNNGAAYYQLFKITDPITNPVLTSIQLNLATYYGSAPSGQQLGGDPVANFTWQCKAPVLRDGLLYAAHAIRNTQHTSYSSIKYFVIDVNSNAVIEEVEQGEDGYFFIQPAITVDKDHNIAITYSKSSSSTYIGAYYSTRLFTDPPGLSPSKVMTEGLSPHSNATRWGDYFSAAVDPVNQYDIWLFCEFAKGNNWSTWLTEIRMKPYSGAHAYAKSFTIDLGNVEVGTAPVNITVPFSNYGDADLTINSITSPVGPFTLTNPTAPFTLITYDSTDLEFEFDPTSAAVYEELMVFDNNDPDFPGFTMRGRGFTINPAFTEYLYASTGASDTGKTVWLDRATGSGTELGLSNFPIVRSLAIDPITNIMYGTVAGGSTSQIVRVNAYNGDAYTLYTLPLGTMVGIAFDNSGICYVALLNGQIYTVDLSTGNYTLATTTIQLTSITINPADNQMWASPRVVVGVKDKIYTIDLTTGDATLIGQTGFSKLTNDLAFDETGTLYGVIGGTSDEGELLSINTSDATGTLIGATGFTDVQGLAYTVTGGPPVSVDDDANTTVPTEFSLEQNYPNPFNPATIIKFTISDLRFTTLKVYDVLGSEVSILLNEEKPAGIYEVEFDASSLPSGIYFYKLQAGSFVETKKMVLLK